MFFLALPLFFLEVRFSPEKAPDFQANLDGPARGLLSHPKKALPLLNRASSLPPLPIYKKPLEITAWSAHLQKAFAFNHHPPLQTQVKTANAATKSDDAQGDSIKCLGYKLDEFDHDLDLAIKKMENEIQKLQGDRSTYLKQKWENKKKEAEKSLKNCRHVREIYQKKLKETTTCEDSLKLAREAKTEFGKSCSEFSVGAQSMNCSAAISACEMCPDKGMFGGYNCVAIHQKTHCPALVGEELKSAKEKRDEITEDKKELEEKIGDLEKDSVELENDLNNELADLESEFTEATRKLERHTEEQTTEFYNQMRKGEAKISEDLSKAVSAVQAKIQNAIKVAHSFENAITKTNRDYRKERRKIYMECEVQAQGRLASYRKKRQIAIQTGSYRVSLSNLLKKGRANFASRDAARLKKYNRQCLAKRKADFNDVEEDYKQKLRVIEQQKEQYLAEIKNIQKQLESLHEEARKKQNALVQEYTDLTNKALEHYKREYKSALHSYLKAKDSILNKGKAIALAQTHRAKTQHQLREKDMELVREQRLINYMKAKGVTEEDQSVEFASARANLIEYVDQLAETKGKCCIEQKSSECQDIENWLERIEENSPYIADKLEDHNLDSGQR